MKPRITAFAEIIRLQACFARGTTERQRRDRIQRYSCQGDSPSAKRKHSHENQETKKKQKLCCETWAKMESDNGFLLWAIASF